MYEVEVESDWTATVLGTAQLTSRCKKGSMFTSSGCAMQSEACTNTTLCLKKNDTDVAHYNFNAHQPILVMLAEMLLR